MNFDIWQHCKAYWKIFSIEFSVLKYSKFNDFP